MIQQALYNLQRVQEREAIRHEFFVDYGGLRRKGLFYPCSITFNVYSRNTV